MLLKAILRGAEALGYDIKAIDAGEPRNGAALVLYGLGAPERIIHAGRSNLIAFDAGYWERKLKPEERKYRVSIGGFHCPQLIMRGDNPGPERWNESGLAITQGGNPEGPIMLVGNGPKSQVAGAQGWTALKSRRIRKAFPGRKILYRPKPKRPHEPGIDFDTISHKTIESELDKVSLVVCRHSNVAVDACQMGVPVVCDDGAAASIYPSSLAEFQKQPSAERRAEFLHRLAWWQWTPGECISGKFWTWIEGVIGAIQ